MTRPGLIPGFNDAYVPYPYITNYGATVNCTINPTTFLEVTYGSIKNQLAGGNERRHLDTNAGVEPSEEPARTSRCCIRTPACVTSQLLRLQGPAEREAGVLGRQVGEPAAGLRLGRPRSERRRRTSSYPGWLNINRTQDVAISLTKIAGRHTIKAGVYLNHSYKAQNTARRHREPEFQGYVNFGNDTNNALDSGFGYANAALGVFTQYLQASKFVEGNMVYNQTEVFSRTTGR